MNHTIGIPDWLWDYECARTGCKNPASAIRERIIKSIIDEKTFAPSNEVDFSESDTPTSIVLTRPGICSFCKTTMSTGEDAFYFSFTRGSRLVKAISHPDCWGT